MARAAESADILALASPRRRPTTGVQRRTRATPPLHRLPPPQVDPGERLEAWWRFWLLARSIVLFVVGVTGLGYEALRDGTERPLQLGAYLGCLGLNMVTAGRGSGERE